MPVEWDEFMEAVRTRAAARFLQIEAEGYTDLEAVVLVRARAPRPRRMGALTKADRWWSFRSFEEPEAGVPKELVAFLDGAIMTFAGHSHAEVSESADGWVTRTGKRELDA